MMTRLIVGPGEGIVARRGPAAILIADAADPAVADLLRAWADSEPAAVEEALFAVVAARRPATVTAFCALSGADQKVRVAIHGRLEVVAQVAENTVRVAGADVDSQVAESLVGALRRIVVAAPDHAGPALAANLNLVEGVVPGGSMRLDWDRLDAAPRAARPDPGATIVGLRPPSVAEAEAAFAHRVTSAMPALPTTQAAPDIEGALCAAGHLTDPESAECLVCGGPVSEELARGPRPPLGRLVTSDGQELVVNGPIVIGRRAPGAPEVISGAAQALLVPESEGGASRLHADVTVDGWSVLLRDRDSANGTHLRPAGIREWFRLEPGHPVEIVPGTLIAIVRYEISFEKPRIGG